VSRIAGWSLLRYRPPAWRTRMSTSTKRCGCCSKSARSCAHVVVDPVIAVDLENSRAHVESYWLLFQRDDEGGRPLVVAFGHYHDTMVKQDGRWLIEERLADVQATAAGPGPKSGS
jgi:hypothetical protein